MDQKIKVSDNLSPYEAYQLLWMLKHGYSLNALIQALTDYQYADPEDSDTISTPISKIFDHWEKDVGFDRKIWDGKKDFQEVKGTKEEDKEPALQPGDVCLYSFGDQNASEVIVEIVRLLSTSEAAEIRVLKVIEDYSGNGYFHYLQRSGETMNASLQYLKKLDPKRRAALEENNL